MDIHKIKIVDHELPLTNENHEAFCVEYVRLDIEEQIANKRARRIKAYRFIYPETIGHDDSKINSSATRLLSKKSIKDRIRALYEEEGSSVENEFNWTRSKSETILVDIAYDDMMKPEARLKAISELNKMRGIDVPQVVEEVNNGDSVDQFFAKFKGMVENG